MAFDKNNPKNRKRKKVCQFCVDKATFIDYKDTAKLRRYMSGRSKILPRRTTGVCAMHQRELTEAIKRARQIALLPYVTDWKASYKQKEFGEKSPNSFYFSQIILWRRSLFTVIDAGADSAVCCMPILPAIKAPYW